jgi:hypothetical protein
MRMSSHVPNPDPIATGKGIITDLVPIPDPIATGKGIMADLVELITKDIGIFIYGLRNFFKEEEENNLKYIPGEDINSANQQYAAIVERNFPEEIKKKCAHLRERIDALPEIWKMYFLAGYLPGSLFPGDNNHKVLSFTYLETRRVEDLICDCNLSLFCFISLVLSDTTVAFLAHNVVS